MPLSPECFLGSDPILRRQALYEAFGGTDCFIGLLPEQQEQKIYEALGGTECFLGLSKEARRQALYEAMGGTEACFSGLLLQDQERLIYESLYAGAGDDSLVDPACFAGLSPEEQSYWVYRAALAGVNPHPECVAIPGATNSTYEPTEDDIGFWIRALVTATNSEGSDSAWSNAVGPVTAAPSGPVVSDTFTAANGTALNGRTPSPTTAGFNWAAGVEGDAARQTIQSNAASLDGAVAASRETAVVDSGVADCVVEVTATGSDLVSGSLVIVFRYTDANNHWIAGISGVGQFLYKKAAGSYVLADDNATTGASSTPYTLVATLSGNSVSVSINGGAPLATTDAHNASATKHGIQAFQNIVAFDDFTVTQP